MIYLVKFQFRVLDNEFPLQRYSRQAKESEKDISFIYQGRFTRR